MDRLAELFTFSIPVWEIVLRGSVMYLGLFALFRFVARRHAGALGITDLLVLVLVADAAQNAMAGEYRSINDGLLLVATLVAWDLLIDALAYRFRIFARLAEPPPLLLVRDGKVMQRNLRRELMTTEELAAKLRAAGAQHFSEVSRAYMESDGEITVIKRGGRSGRPGRQRPRAV